MVQISRWWNETCRFCRLFDQWLFLALRVIVVALSLYGGYLLIGWWQDDSPVVEYPLGEASTTTARPNDVVIFYQPVRKFRNCWGTVRRVVMGDCGFFVISEAQAWIQAPWEGRLTYAIQIPHEAIPGDCGFQVVTRFICTPFDLWSHARIVSTSPIKFRVLRYDQ